MTTSLDLLPASARLRGYAGDDIGITFAFTSHGAPYPVVGTWKAQLRSDPSDTTELGHFTIDGTNAANGMLLLKLPSNLTAVLPVGVLIVWDLQWTDTAAVTRTLVKGTLTLESDVSR